MRVAIDARLLTGAYTGDRTYWRGLLKALIRQLEGSAHQLVLFSARPLPPEALPPLARVGDGCNPRALGAMVEPVAFSTRGATLRLPCGAYAVYGLAPVSHSRHHHGA
ncbi:MAG: hypothetical protein KatS3mg021_1647 [Fimbriimonadales bacterium]|nr:MAG: hypothetical protein KatS3mg021_1647 [Fimbriimonadales bacterium]